MNITVALAFSEVDAVSLLNWLARVNRRILLENPELPGLYQSGVVYKRETEETWSDYINLLAQGWEDCDSLASARAGELLARGWRALKRGDGGFDEARRRRPASIPAEVFLRTRTPPDEPGLYHCLVRYRVGSRWHLDDPSARLGMLDQRLNGPEVTQRLALQQPQHPRRRGRST